MQLRGKTPFVKVLYNKIPLKQTVALTEGGVTSQPSKVLGMKIPVYDIQILLNDL